MKDLNDLINKLTEIRDKYGNLPVVSYFSNMEQNGYMTGHLFPEVKFAIEKQTQTWDAFDNTSYSYTEYMLSDKETEGSIQVVSMGNLG